MAGLPGYRRPAEGTHPPYLHPPYRSSLKRAPREPLVRIEHTLSEVTGPVFGPEVVDACDLARGPRGEALGERIVVSGRVLDEDGRPVRGTLVALGLGATEYVVDAIDLLQAGKTLTSSIEGDSDPQEMVPRLLEMRAAGTFPMDDLVTTYPAEEIGQAVADVTSGAVVKPVLVW